MMHQMPGQDGTLRAFGRNVARIRTQRGLSQDLLAEKADLDRTYVLNLEHSALTFLADRRRDDADATVTLPRAILDRLVLRQVTVADAVQQGLVTIEGDEAKVVELFGLLDDFSLMFPIVEPRQA